MKKIYNISGNFPASPIILLTFPVNYYIVVHDDYKKI